MTYLAAAAAPLASSTNPLIPSATELVLGAIGFVVIFGVLGKVLLPRIQQTLADRTDAIEGGIQRAEQMQHEAEEALQSYRAQLEDARREAARLREEAREEGAQIKAEIVEQARGEASRLVEAAHTQIDSDRQQALNELRRQVGELAVELAGRLVGESLTDEARQNRVVDRFLDEMESQGDQAARLRAGR